MGNELKSLFPGTTVIVNHYGIDPIPGNILTKARPPELVGKLVITSAGIFYERKAFPLLVRAFNRIATRHQNLVLRICGDGVGRAEVEQAIREGPASDRICLLGMQSHDKVMQEMVWSDVFALIGWDEPYGMVFLEAMAAGKPIVCANDGGINDVVASGVHGLTVPPRDLDAAADALEQLISDSTLRQQCGAAAKQLCETTLSSEVSVAKLFSVLQAAAQHQPITAAD